MFKKFAAVFAALMLAILALVPMTASASSTMYVSANNGLSVNVRNLPDRSSRSLARLGVGFPVKVNEYDTEWSSVTVKLNGRTMHGFINSTYLKDRNPLSRAQRFKTVDNTFTVTVRPSSANGRVNLWPSASKKGEEIRTLNKGEELTVLAASNAWYQVQDSQGNTGYVAKAYVKK